MRKVLIIILIYLIYFSTLLYSQYKETKLLPFYTTSTSIFGTSLSLQFPNLFIGDPHYFNFSGALYHYKLENGTWKRKNTIRDLITGNKFTNFLEFSDSTLFVGANGRSSIYVYKLDKDSLVLKQVLKPNTPITFELYDFGANIGVYGNWLIGGAPLDSSGYGGAYIYKKINNEWKYVQRISPLVLQSSSFFGKDVAIYEDRIAIGSSQLDKEGMDLCGAVYLYEIQGDSVVYKGELTPPKDIRSTMMFGTKIKFKSKDDLLIITHATEKPGKIYHYKYMDSTWVEFISFSNPTTASAFGDDILLKGDSLITSAPSGIGQKTGYGLFYKFENNQWNLKTTFAPIDSKYYNWFGTSVGMDEGHFVFGSSNRVPYGAAYVFSPVVSDIPDQFTEGVQSFSLSQNYPNPFNPSTIINYSVEQQGFVSLKVYNQLGELVEVLVNELKPTVNYSVTFKGSNLPAGVYFYRLEAGSFAETKKLVLLK